jgi:hypothetical protein
MRVPCVSEGFDPRPDPQPTPLDLAQGAVDPSPQLDSELRRID